MDFGQDQVMEFPRHLLRKWRDLPCVPCSKCDEDSHGNSTSFHIVTNRLGGGLVQIDLKYLDYSMPFTQVLLVLHAGT